MDIQLLEDQLNGLEANLSNLQKLEKDFIKAQGMDETIARLQAQADDDKVVLEKKKTSIKEVEVDRTAVVIDVATSLSSGMEPFLPTGAAIVDINEEKGEVQFGWLLPGDKEPRPYEALSGGEKALFNAALCNAMLGDDEGHKIVIIEAAEADESNLNEMVKRINRSKPPTQVFINRWHRPSRKPQGWNLIEL